MARLLFILTRSRNHTSTAPDPQLRVCLFGFFLVLLPALNGRIRGNTGHGNRAIDENLGVNKANCDVFTKVSGEARRAF